MSDWRFVDQVCLMIDILGREMAGWWDECWAGGLAGVIVGVIVG